MTIATLNIYSSFILLFLMEIVTAKDVTYDWTLQSVVSEVYSPDCMNTKEERRSMFLVEDSFPGPTIEADEGDTIIVRVTNNNPATSASIHFHGVHQKGTPFSDGAAFITQCALGPLQSQVYTFDAYPPGTHYWHDHTSYNLADGISGPIIIHPKTPEPFVYDEERVRAQVESALNALIDWYISCSFIC
jgi:FtsP/CotA-like multicopper oxidase with cupredoxin domain